MKQSGYKSVLHIYVICLILLMGTLVAGFITLLYNITIKKPDGRIGLSKWPIDFTEDFSAYIAFAEDIPIVKQSGLTLLQENHLWLQIIDTNGDEIQSFQRPNQFPMHYSPSDLLDIYQGGRQDYSVFFGKIGYKNETWTYMIGFPVKISKITVYVNKDRFDTAKPIIYVMLGALLVLLLITSSVYGFQVAGQMERIRKAIRDIASRTYISPLRAGYFQDVYDEIKNLNTEIRMSDEARAATEKLREEWIANITHDLKTPLSPIKGYAELISDPERIPGTEDIRKFGNIICKNVTYAEELINDLKLTYQLKSELLPLNKIHQDIIRFTKELIIDLLNHPEYEDRKLSFYSSREKYELLFDPVLLRRALNNLLTNAVIHNSKETLIQVSINISDRTEIVIEDNGCGMNREELDNLFVRYYRGNNSEIKPEGTGLGMAIAKQIIELHEGMISAESEVGSGTTILLVLPVQTA
jgi:Signal transduction histidine kinase